jgi:hypothetical protein
VDLRGEPADARKIEARPVTPRARRDAYVYFDNDAKVRAPFDARSLAEKLDRAPECEPDAQFEERRLALARAGSRLTAEQAAERRIEASRRWKD